MSDFLDLSEWRAAIKFVMQVTKKTEVEILNRSGLVCIIGGKGVKGAMKRTPRANLAGLNPKAVAGFVADKLRKKGVKFGAPKTGIATASVSRGKGGRFQKGSGKRSIINLAAGATVSAQEFQQLVKREIARRKSSVAYTAGPGWDQAARFLGGRGVKRQRGFDKSKAAAGGAVKATVSRLVTIIENTTPAAQKIGTEALQAALNDTARDMVEYGERKLAKTLAKASAK